MESMNDVVDKLMSMLPLLIPVILLEWGLLITALVHLLKNKKVRNLNIVAWAVIIVIFNIIGPILYFLIGRADE